MVPRKPLANWQSSAHDQNRRRMSFASACGLGEAGSRAADRRLATLVCKDTYPDCYPSLTLRLGPKWVEPFFLTRGAALAKIRQGGILGFSVRSNAVESAAITTLKRGSHTCVSQFLSWHFYQRRLCPVAWRMVSTPIARHWVPLPAACLARPRTTIWRKARLSAASRVLSRAIRACATDLVTAPRQMRGGLTTFRAIGGDTPVAFSFANPAEGGFGGMACSRKY